MSAKESSEVRCRQFLSNLVTERNLGSLIGGPNERAVHKNTAARDRKANDASAPLDEALEGIHHVIESLIEAY